MARDPERFNEAKAALAIDQNQHHHVLVADFNRPDELKAALAGYLSQTDPVDVLVNNS